MLLTIFLGLIANLTFLSAECDVETPKLKDFDWDKVANGHSWYVLIHSSNSVENNIDCFKVTTSLPNGNISLTNFETYVISEKRNIKTYGYKSNWTSTGYFEIHHPLPMWSGQAYVIAVDYNRYIILKLRSFKLGTLNVYVGFRCKHPDEATLKEVLKVLHDNNIDVRKLAMSGTDHCQ